MISEMAFQGRWRDYQDQVLADLDTHLADDKLHVVAAPGSGKTVLGLEVMRRIGQPALILAPTIAVRNQWVDRLCAMFLPAPHTQPDWVSTSLAAPAPVTVLTYQALYAAMGEIGDRIEPDIINPEIIADDTVEEQADAAPVRIETLLAYFQALGPTTIILDEAHHLRREWWRALNALHAALPEARLVSLTATPPYDVEYTEWIRYETLCGPIDAEIPVPELVRNGDLCPHQDHVHVSQPTGSEDAVLAARRDGLYAFVTTLLADAGFRALILAHPYLTNTAAHEEEILAAPEFFSSMLIFAFSTDAPPPREALHLLGIGRADMPPMSLGWLEILLTGLLFAKVDQIEDKARLTAIRADLRQLGAIEARRVRLVDQSELHSTVAGSIAKLGSVIEIAQHEVKALGDDLRMVVLADHVRAGDMPRRAGDPFLPTKLGVVPIFEALRRAGIGAAKLGILTGSLVIVPIEAQSALERGAYEVGIAADHLRIMPLGHDPRYLRIEIGGESGHRIVQLITALFNQGEVTLLVGTQALLGEGWDAPTVNTLVLANYVGSYMLSNQMRGRAIRTDPRRPDKAANIWHLATVVPQTLAGALSRGLGWLANDDPSDPIGRPLGPDMAMLIRRFRAFEGISETGSAQIENGLGRLGLAGRDWNAAAIRALNAETLVRSGQRAGLGPRWRAALDGTTVRPRMRQITRVNHTPRLLPLADTLRYLAITGVIGGLFSAANALRNRGLPSSWGVAAMIFLGLTLLYALPKLGKALYLLVRNGTLEGSMTQVGQAVVDSLAYAGLLGSDPDAIRIEARKSALGKSLVHIEGATRIEERLILDSIEEVLGPVRNPRYLLMRGSPLGRWLRIDYHAVPTAIGQHKDAAEFFARRWARHVGTGKLVYLRSAKGRRILLRARTRSMAAGFQRAVDRLSVWQ
ncbi:DEAD/DEAH box helicase family protein [Sphingomonas alpina]|uniref:DEAD/DEAH box helicase family protein n=1 Tax=Sphingomonas alpina TaxID=653931 RepID=UPI0021BA4D6D|nr:DEAD/DEAH box helicase family protein [Sphingomonas alpina]